MRVLVHDFAGHPFQVQLSRELAVRGHRVTHVYPIGLDGPKGRLESCGSDSDRLEIVGVPLHGFQKYSPLRRLASQQQYARDVARIIGSERFDVALSGNTPIEVQARLLRHCRRHEVGFVHWVQDVYCQALKFFLLKRIGRLGAPFSYPFFLLERWVARKASSNVVIAPAFAQMLAGWGVAEEKISVLENWAPLDEVRPLARGNAWSHEQGLDGKMVFLYSGTLGMKHRPDLIYQLAKSLGDAHVVAITEGVGREYLERMPRLENLRLLDFQPYGKVPQVLASADVLLATLESDAGQFAVPSKILSYLCAARPLLLAAPGSNLAASIVERSGAGLVVDPNRPGEWIAAAHRLAQDSGARASMGTLGRVYAEREFEISGIAERFENVLLRARRKSSEEWVPQTSRPFSLPAERESVGPSLKPVLPGRENRR